MIFSLQIVLNGVVMRRGAYDLKQREGLREIRADRLAHDVLGRIVTGVDEVETVGIEEVVVAQVGGDEGIAALRDGLRDVVAAGAAADGYAMDRLSAVAEPQTAAS